MRLHLGHLGASRSGHRTCCAVDRATRLPPTSSIAAIGVRPETSLAAEAGLAIGARGGIAVDERSGPATPRIYAVGDAVEKHDGLAGRSRRSYRSRTPPTGRAGLWPT